VTLLNYIHIPLQTNLLLALLIYTRADRNLELRRKWKQ